MLNGRIWVVLKGRIRVVLNGRIWVVLNGRIRVMVKGRIRTRVVVKGRIRVRVVVKGRIRIQVVLKGRIRCYLEGRIWIRIRNPAQRIACCMRWESINYADDSIEMYLGMKYVVIVHKQSCTRYY